MSEIAILWARIGRGMRGIAVGSKGKTVSRTPKDSAQHPASVSWTSKRPVNRVCPMDEGPVGVCKPGSDRCRMFRGKMVGFCGGECARAWDGLDDAEKQQRLTETLADS